MALALAFSTEEIADQVGQLAKDEAVRAACASFARWEPWLRQQQIEVSRIPAPTGLEGRRAEWMRREFEHWGWQATIDEAGNAVALWPARAHAPLVAFSAHLDTAFPAGTPVEPVFQNGKLHGPGVSDNGAGLTALLALARAAAECQWSPPPAWALIANVGEEGEGNLRGMRYFFERSPWRDRIAFTIVVDGPGCDQITVGALGSRRVKVTFRGPGGHSWTDAGTASAIHGMGRAVAKLAAQATAQPGLEACSVGLIEGGSTLNAIAASAAMKVDLRAAEPARLEALTRRARQAIEAAVEEENRAARQGRVEADWEIIGERPWGALDAEARLWRTVRVVDAQLGIHAQPQAASTDANIPLSLGREALRLGAGGRGGGAHTPREWYDPLGRDIALQRLLLTGLALAD